MEQRNVATVRMYDSLSTISSITLSLSVTHCLTPPTPPAPNNLTLQGWEDLHSMSSWNTKINYTCSAGGHNAFVSDRWRDFFELTCHENNSFTTPTWPTCVSSMIYIELKLFWVFYKSFQQSTVHLHLIMKLRRSRAQRYFLTI